MRCPALVARARVEWLCETAADCRSRPRNLIHGLVRGVAAIAFGRFIGSHLSRHPPGCCNGRMKPDPDQTRWDRIDRRITHMRLLAAIILALLLGASVLLLR
jgi:hypothetical protein